MGPKWCACAQNQASQTSFPDSPEMAQRPLLATPAHLRQGLAWREFRRYPLVFLYIYIYIYILSLYWYVYIFCRDDWPSVVTTDCLWWRLAWSGMLPWCLGDQGTGSNQRTCCECSNQRTCCGCSNQKIFIFLYIYINRYLYFYTYVFLYIYI